MFRTTKTAYPSDPRGVRKVVFQMYFFFFQTIQKMLIRSDIRFRFALTEMTCLMTNDATFAKELTFDVTLPKGAFISNFSM